MAKYASAVSDYPSKIAKFARMGGLYSQRSICSICSKEIGEAPCPLKHLAANSPMRGPAATPLVQPSLAPVDLSRILMAPLVCTVCHVSTYPQTTGGRPGIRGGIRLPYCKI